MSPTNKHALFRQIPAVDTLLKAVEQEPSFNEIPTPLLKEAITDALQDLRVQLTRSIETEEPAPEVSTQAIVTSIRQQVQAQARPSLQPMMNATGTLLHTNLGRAPLATAALEAVSRNTKGYSNLELDIASGKRGHRSSHVESVLCRLTGAEAALAVNNNAGAVLLVLTALASGKEAIVSRGELVEIGGAFRIPEVMKAGGVTLREVGATNKTHFADYAAAISAQTGLLLKVHTSNYRIMGFSADVPSSELVALGREKQVPVMEDLGSGMLLDLTAYGLPAEPTVADSVASGLDVVTFSGDKLLGGPQAGIIVGRSEAIDRIRRHPMARALRLDKQTLAALEATLRLYFDPKVALTQVPVLRMLSQPLATLKQRAEDMCRTLACQLGGNVTLSVQETTGRVGGGALPMTDLPDIALAVGGQGLSVEGLARRLRQGPYAVVGTLRENTLLLHLRTVDPSEDATLMKALTLALSEAIEDA